ncbi:hypothetical protein AAMO2058_001264700 [Amorphochlora amoebiformis]
MAEMASLMPPLAPSRSISSDQTRKQLPRNMSWGLLQELQRLEQSPGVYHGALLMLAINFHAQIFTDITKNGLRFNYACLLSPIIWTDLLTTNSIILLLIIPLSILSTLLTTLLTPSRPKSHRISAKIGSSRVAVGVHTLMLAVQLLLPHYVLTRVELNPISAAVASAVATCLTLKTHSFFAKFTLHGGGAIDRGPIGKLMHFTRFLFVPALVYSRSSMEAKKKGEGIRWGKIVSNWLQGIACLVWISIVFCQQIVPVLMNERPELIHMLEICVPANLCWFLAFYCVFKANFAILAELTQYPARRFYGDWWNATTVEQFWRRWNVPVHDFAVDHVYYPCLQTLKLSPESAGAVVFVLSAILHEMTFAVAFKCPNCYFITVGMIIQVPLIHYSRFLQDSRRGNILVWLNFVLGITLMAQLYFQQWHNCCSSSDKWFQVFYRGPSSGQSSPSS